MRLLRIDSIAGLSAGLLMFLLHDWLTVLYQLPPALVWGVAAANVSYGATSGTIVLLQPADTAQWLRRMGIANLVWAVVCVALAIRWSAVASWFGIAALVGEAAFVGGLGWLEWRAETVGSSWL